MRGHQLSLWPATAPAAETSDDWYTPPWLIALARQALGGAIDLDPASCALANSVVRAATYYTIEQDGLLRPWSGRIWLNPPYSQPAPFVERLIDHWHDGTIEAAILVTNASVETRWHQPAARAATAVLYPAPRVQFWAPGKPTGGNRNSQTLFYYGPDRDRFVSVFAGRGRIEGVS